MKSSLPFPIVITKQNSEEQDKIRKNGKIKNVHAVIKNHNFQITLSCDMENFFLHSSVECTLLYDCVGPEKPVNFIRKSPLNYDCKPSMDGKTVTVDMCITILSSQHENMLFVIKFSSSGSTVLSEPIKVVSKPAQLKINKVKRGRKRTFNDALKESLSRIEEEQKTQKALLSSFLESLQGGQPSLSLSVPPPVCPVFPEEPQKKRIKTEDISPKDLFEQQLNDLFATYQTLSDEDSSVILRKVVGSSNVHTQQTWAELVDRISVEGLGKNVGYNISTNSPW
eukprot:CAMPEP_0174253062 /NCGR_PEP_ID=MMETSP0439-20130205/2438_1 /TAXON_ID=0 /ORGANISM="Stereomyxa ramosa, Strain Chinc5" /LENGTH=281 /DNA_ID=CAMNT_0015333873 /DNA_START=56 /DNA_END=898 /DNA_ORIENTATION=-